MKNKRAFLSILVALSIIVLCSCQVTEFSSIQLDNDPSPQQNLVSTSNNLTLSINENLYPYSPTFIRIKLINNGKNSCSFGQFFRIEQLVNNHWYYVVYDEDIFQNFPNFIDIGLILEPYSEIDQVQSLKNINLLLPEGNFRVVKTLMCPVMNGKEISLSVPFKIMKDK